MSRKGNCFDNAAAESFFKSIKVEWIYKQSYTDQKQATLLIFELIESWYNRRRRHSSLGYKTIEEYQIINSNFKHAA
jgi:transposase InsO family protein